MVHYQSLLVPPTLLLRIVFAARDSLLYFVVLLILWRAVPTRAQQYLYPLRAVMHCY